MEDKYAKKYELLLEKYMEVDTSNEKLQNRICHIRKQIRYLRRLKRLLIQKLVIYGDRFMDVCLEIPDMEPGANVEDQIIRRIAEIPQPSTSAHASPVLASRGSSGSLTGVVAGSAGGPLAAGASMKKRRRVTVTEEESAPPFMRSLSGAGSVSNPVAQLNRSASYKKSIATASPSSGTSTPSGLVKFRRESHESHHTTTVASTPTSNTQQHQHVVSASVEDVVNSIVLDCQQRRKEAEEKAATDEAVPGGEVPRVTDNSAGMSAITPAENITECDAAGESTTRECVTVVEEQHVVLPEVVEAVVEGHIVELEESSGPPADNAMDTSGEQV